jgi:hypothetical protein
LDGTAAVVFAFANAALIAIQRQGFSVGLRVAEAL